MLCPVERLSLHALRCLPGPFEFAQGTAASASGVILMACVFCRPEDLCSPRPHERLQAELHRSSGAKERRHQDDTVADH